MPDGGTLEFLESEIWVALELCLLIAGALCLLMGLKKTLKSPLKHKINRSQHQTMD